MLLASKKQANRKGRKKREKNQNDEKSQKRKEIMTKRNETRWISYELDRAEKGAKKKTSGFSV
jgi:hypothetical protein